MRYDCSWWPCVAIMTSASSRQKTRSFFGSKHRRCSQSSTVPGVPTTTCAVCCGMKSTWAHERCDVLVRYGRYKSSCVLETRWGERCPTRRALDGERDADGREELGHLLHHVADLPRELVRRREAQALHTVFAFERTRTFNLHESVQAYVRVVLYMYSVPHSYTTSMCPYTSVSVASHPPYAVQCTYARIARQIADQSKLQYTPYTAVVSSRFRKTDQY